VTSRERAEQCPVTEDVSDRVLRLPLYNDLDNADQGRVVEALHAFGRP
jgi:dTDP-4-amino-4,6-dideoxygalactose transaminase